MNNTARLKRELLKNICTVIFVLGFGYTAQAQNDVLTQHYDLGRTGWFNKESILHTRNVKAGYFGKIFSRTVDDQIYAQPLVMQVAIPTVGVRNLVIVATVNNSLYAFDADSANLTQPYWQKNLTPAGSRAIKNTDMTGACGGGYRDFSGNMGIVGTPVIDATTNTLYIVARSVSTSSSNFQQYLHALDVISGNEKPNSPILIAATVNGNGDGSISGKVSFDAQKQNQRPGLLLLNGIVYISYASHCDWGPYHGWIIGYNAGTLQQKNVYNTTPEGYNGGIWMSGAAPSADEAGNIYAAVGNGSIGRNNNFSDPVNRSESALKLTPIGSSLTLNSFFTPKNISELEAADLDFGVTEVLLVPNTNRALVGCKDGKLYLLDRDNMGGFNASINNVIQTVDLGTNAHLRSSFAYYKGAQKEFIYTWSENSLLKALMYNRTTNQFDLNGTISSGVQGPIGNNGALLSVSSNTSIDSTAIVWASHAANGDANQSVRPGILRALDANDVTKELWNSSAYPSDNPGNYAKFNCPVIANGKVYLATFSNQLVVYGLLKNSTSNSCSSINIGLGGIASSSNGNAQLAIDGNAATEWVSQTMNPQWISVNLGKRFDLCKVMLKWGSKFGVNYSIQVSDDAINWTSLVNISGNASTNNTLFVNGAGQFVRMNGTIGQNGFSIGEFEIYGTASVKQCVPPFVLPITNVYENSATLNWSSNGTNFAVQYKTVSAGEWTSLAATSNSIIINGLGCATDYLFRVSKVCSSLSSSDYSPSGSFSTLSCNQNCGSLPTRWSTQDIGDVDAAGSACFSNSIFTLKGSGNDIWDNADGFRFAYKTFVGDGDFSTRVVSMDNSNPWNKCGIMVRESLTEGSRHAFIAITSGNGAAFQNRLITDGASNNFNTGNGIKAPYWVKLSKHGSVLTGFVSTDGVLWTQLGNPVETGFGNGVPVYMGLALTSHYNGVISTASLDNLSISGSFDYALENFTGNLNLDKSVSLQWSTTLESNLKQFVIERSNNLVDYSSVDSVDAINQGRFIHKYSYSDLNPTQGFNYYRLRMVTNDGIQKISASVAIWINTLAAPLVYPNPTIASAGGSKLTSQTVYVAQGDEPVKFINFYTTSGSQVIQVTNESLTGLTEISISSLSNGIYIVEIITEHSVYKTKLSVRN